MKKTIGFFIAQLRKEQNITQKELAEYLFISDKTVSRWESGKSAPDLDLIPTIADFFHVSVEELLRGERIPAPSELENNTSEKEFFKQSKPCENSLNGFLENKAVKFKNFTFLSVGIFIIGIFIAIICNFVFYRAILGFCLACLFTILSLISQFCFINTALQTTDNTSKNDKNIILTYNSNIIKKSINFFIFILCAFGCIIPFVTVSNFKGLTFSSWARWSLFYVFLLFIFTYLTKKLIIEKVFIKKGWIILTEKEKLRNTLERKTLKRVGIPCGVIGIILIILMIVFSSLNSSVFIEPYTFDNYEDFKNYMAIYDYPNTEENIIGSPPPNPDKEPTILYLYNSKNEIVCEYEWNNQDAYRIQVNIKKDNCLPIKVYAYTNNDEAVETKAFIVDCIKVIFGIDCMVFLILYIIKTRKPV